MFNDPNENLFMRIPGTPGNLREPFCKTDSNCSQSANKSEDKVYTNLFYCFLIVVCFLFAVRNSSMEEAKS